MRVLIIGMPPFAIFECGKRFVQAQGLFHANTYVLVIAAPLSALLSWLFVWRLGWGFIGAPIAVVITQWTMPTLLLLYVCFIDGSRCWGGFSRRAFSNWGCNSVCFAGPCEQLPSFAYLPACPPADKTAPMIRLALPGMIMIEAEYFAFEILTLASSQFGTSELAAQSILVTITATMYQIPFPCPSGLAHALRT